MIKGDGNCFYRCIALATTGDENNFGSIKMLLADYLYENQNIFNDVADLEEMERIIRKDKEPAPFEVILIMTEWL